MEEEEETCCVSVAQRQFTCPVCLVLMKEPVTISCGHSYCMGCIKHCWDREEEEEKGSYSCPQCRQTFTPRPVVRRNPILAEMVEKLINTTGVEPTPSVLEEEAGPGEVKCTLCVGRKRKADKSCLECLSSYCVTHFNRHEEFLMGKRHKVVEAVEHLEERICPEHSKPLEMWCRTDQTCICPLCIIDQHKGHDIISAAEAKTEKGKESSCSFKGEITRREEELQKLKEAVDPFKHSAQAALDASETIFTELMASVEKRRSETKDLIVAQVQAELSQVDQLQRHLERRVIELSESVTGLDRLSQTEDPIHFLQMLPSLHPPQYLREITVSSHTYFEDAKTLVSQLGEHVEDSLKKDFDALASTVKKTFVENENRKYLLQYFCQPTMDVYTAFRHHSISEQGTKATWSHQVISRGNREDRFASCRQVLCNNGLSGCHYWEVQWEGGVSIAVAYSTIDREGYECRFGGNDLSWSLSVGSSLTFSHNDVKIEIHRPISPRIGVYLNHKAGTLSFYSVSKQTVTLLHRVHTTFTQPLYPGFHVDSHTDLKICEKQNVAKPYHFNASSDDD